jgi:hypothetical protein
MMINADQPEREMQASHSGFSVVHFAVVAFYDSLI